MADRIERVRKLVALAADANTPSEEARNAAVAACRIIVEQKLTISNGGGVSAFDEIFASAVRDMERAGEDSFDEAIGRRRWPGAGPTPKGRPAAPKRDTSETLITARSAGFCAACGDAYAQGERVVWVALRREILHVECFRGQGRRPDLG